MLQSLQYFLPLLWVVLIVWVQGEKASSSQFMVVYQYGSAVLFNMEEQEVESYLGIIKKHASGLLNEMRKDGQYLYADLPVNVFFLAQLNFMNLQMPTFSFFFYCIFSLFIFELHIDHIYINDNCTQHWTWICGSWPI